MYLKYFVIFILKFDDFDFIWLHTTSVQMLVCSVIGISALYDIGAPPPTIGRDDNDDDDNDNTDNDNDHDDADDEMTWSFEKEQNWNENISPNLQVDLTVRIIKCEAC